MKETWWQYAIATLIFGVVLWLIWPYIFHPVFGTLITTALPIWILVVLEVATRLKKTS